VVGRVWFQLGSGWHSQATLYLFQKNIDFIGGRNTFVAMKLQEIVFETLENIWSCMRCAFPLTAVPLHPHTRMEHII